jgi:hypothetical protein
MFLALVTSLLVFFAPAHAQSMALEPQVRGHLGLNVVDGPSGIGVTGGMDARLTRLFALDVGAFVSPLPIGDDYTWDGATDAGTPDYYRLRHGVYATPGLRIPHPQPKTWAWDVFLRGGGGVIWTTNLAPSAVANEGTNDAVRADLGGVVGADALVRFGRFGVRAFGKAWMFDVVQTTPTKTFFLVRPQYGLEALVQW